MTRVAICIATCQRPRGLDRLLGSLALLRFERNPEPEIRVIVVDNDGTGTARPVARRWAEKLQWPLVYEIEQRRGIPFVRNRLVKLAEDVDFIAFIDDDELARIDWLDELMRIQQAYQADIVTGPVLPRFECPPPMWMVNGKFFERPRHNTGDCVNHTGTGNVLIRRTLLSHLEGPFERRLALQGGSDTLLFRQLQQQLGTKIVWADNAIVEESVPKSRLSVKWLLKRAYRGGNTYTLCDAYLSSSRSYVLRRGLQGLGRIAQGTILLIPALLLGPAKTTQAFRYICLGAGTLTGIIGHTYNEYQTIHGN